MTYRIPDSVRKDLDTLAAICAAAPADIRLVLTAVAEIPLPQGEGITTRMPRDVIEAARRCVK